MIKYSLLLRNMIFLKVSLRFYFSDLINKEITLSNHNVFEALKIELLVTYIHNFCKFLLPLHMIINANLRDDWVGAPAPTQQFWKPLGGVSDQHLPPPAGPQAPQKLEQYIPPVKCAHFQGTFCNFL